RFGGRRWSVAVSGFTEKRDDLPQIVQRTEMFRLDERRFRQALLQCRQNFDALDRVDAEIGVERHVEIEHLGRVTGLFADDLQQDLLDTRRVPCGCYGLWRSLRGSWRGRGVVALLRYGLA